MGNKTTRSKSKRAQERREALIQKLGGRCANIDCESPLENLELDHIHGRDWNVIDYSQMGRVRKYEKEAAAGLLQVLCASCNKKKQ